MPRLVNILRVLAMSLISLSALAQIAPDHIVRFSSGPTSKVFRFNSAFLGFAQNVCLNATNPANCPPDATIYGLEVSAWLADLSSIPDATWIYAPGITGLTSPAELNIYFFETAFNIPATPTEGVLYVAADDSAQIIVNGSLVAVIGSTTNVVKALDAQNNIHQFDITPFLVQGKNHVRIHLKNGPASFGSCPIPDSYSCNPGGVVYGGSATW